MVRAKNSKATLGESGQPYEVGKRLGCSVRCRLSFPRLSGFESREAAPALIFVAHSVPWLVAYSSIYFSQARTKELDSYQKSSHSCLQMKPVLPGSRVSQFLNSASFSYVYTS